MSRRSHHRRKMAPLLVKIAKEAGIMGEIFESEPPGRDAKKIRALLIEAANEEAEKKRKRS